MELKTMNEHVENPDNYYDIYNNEIISSNIDHFWEANSESGSDSSHEELFDHDLSRNHILSFRKLKRKIYKQCDTNIVHKHSTVLDVFMRYIQCHHVLYSEASYYCSYKLNLFMLPCMFLSTTCSVITSVHLKNVNISTLIAIFNGIISFLLAIVNYLKLDANAEAHKISAYQYTKLESHIKVHSGELLLYENDSLLTDDEYIHEQLSLWDKKEGSLYENDKIKQRANDRISFHNSLIKYKQNKEKEFNDKVQMIMTSIKETLKNVEDNNNFSLPRHILRKYSEICNMNIFLYIRSIDTYKQVLLNDLRNVKNEIRFYKNKGYDINPSYRDKFKLLYKQKNDLVRNFFEINKGYTLIDRMLQQELINVELMTKYNFLFTFQNILNCFGSSYNILPERYMKSTHIGYMDKDGKYLLEKVLEN